MSALAQKLAARIEARELHVSSGEQAKVLGYLELLSRWNRRMNLTAFDLSSPSDAAIDRLVIEPFAASAFVRPGDRVGLDVGSGGGSPALPLAIRCPSLRMTLVESRLRKAAFLREAIRVLELTASVAARRLEDIASSEIERGSVDVVSMRAVRWEAGVARAVGQVLKGSGRVLFFGHTTHSHGISFVPPEVAPFFELSIGSRRDEIEDQ